MDVKHVYEAPEAEALSFCQEENFCDSMKQTVTVNYGGDQGQFFDEEVDW